MKVFVKAKDRKRVLDHTIDAINLYHPGTTTLSGTNIFKFKRIAYALADLVKITGFRYNTDRKRRLISRGIKRFTRYKKKTLAFFIKALETELARLDKIRPKRFFVVFPLNVLYQALRGKRHFVVNNVKLMTRPYRYVSRIFNFDKPFFMMRRVRELRSRLYDFTYVIVEVHAKSEEEALSTSDRQVFLLRALWNIALFYGRITWQFPPAPLSRVNPPKYVFVFDENNNYVTYGYNIGEFRYRPYRLTVRELGQINNIVRRFEALKPCELKDILADALMLYNYALDEIRSGYAFLNFWQILELITLKDPSGISMDTVRKRLKAIFLDKPLVCDVIDAFFRKRNQLVHEGKMTYFSLEDVNHIKLTSEACIHFLFSHVNKLKSKNRLNLFYENVRFGKPKLRTKMSILKYIQKSKP